MTSAGHGRWLGSLLARRGGAGRTHLGDRAAALVDGELSHQARDRALSHIAHCAACRSDLATQRAAKAMLAAAAAPQPAPDLVVVLQALAAPGGPPLPPRARAVPEGPVVPDLPAPGRPRPDTRRPEIRRPDIRRPGSPRTDSRGPASRPLGAGRTGPRRTRPRVGVLTAGVLSAAGLVLATAFVAGGSPSSPTGPVVPPVAELSVEHSRTTNSITVGDPGLTVSDLATTSTRR